MDGDSMMNNMMNSIIPDESAAPAEGAKPRNPRNRCATPHYDRIPLSPPLFPPLPTKHRKGSRPIKINIPNTTPFGGGALLLPLPRCQSPRRPQLPAARMLFDLSVEACKPLALVFTGGGPPLKGRESSTVETPVFGFGIISHSLNLFAIHLLLPKTTGGEAASRPARAAREARPPARPARPARRGPRTS
jgi:hypothetical protein